MSDSKVFMIPDAMTGANNSQVDPNLLLTSIMNNGGFNGNGNWIWIIFLFFLFGWRNNGWGNNGITSDALGTGYLSNQINNGTGRELLMQAINGNGQALGQLSSMLNSDLNAVKTALTSVQSAIAQVSNQVGMSAADVKNAVTMGNMNLAQQLAQCCCDNKLLVTTQGYENQLATLNQTNTLQNAINQNTVNQQEGFTTVTFQNQTQTANLQAAMNANTQNLKDATVAQTNAIMAKLDAIEDSRKDREISTLTAQLAAATAKAEREAELAPIVKQLDQIQCKQPSTVTTQYSPFVAVPNCVAWNSALYNGGFPFQQNGSIWS